MTNNAFHKLVNETMFNSLNDTYISICKNKNVSTYFSARETETYVEIRKECKAKGVWLEDACESDIYVYTMPFGGWKGNEVKAVIKEYRRLKKEIGSNAAYHTIMERR